MHARLFNIGNRAELPVFNMDVRTRKNNFSSKQKSVIKFIENIFSYLDETTNPALLRKIISNLKINKLNSTNAYFNHFIEKIKHEPIDLIKMRKAIAVRLSKNKAICDLLYFINRNKLLSENEIKMLVPLFNTQLNVLCLLEAFSITMSNDINFGEEIYSFVTQQRCVSQPGNPIYNFFASSPNKFSLFKSLKLISVDPAITAFAFMRSLGGKSYENDEIKQKGHAFIKKYGLKYFNTDIFTDLSNKYSDVSVKNVSLNILEAVWEDSHLDNTANLNANTGAGLIWTIEYLRPTNGYVLCEKVLPQMVFSRNDDSYNLLPDLKINTSLKYTHQFHVSKEWMDLYISWNLLFVLEHFDYCFLPLKLLLPSVLDAIPKHFMETRISALFLFGNLFHFNKINFFPTNKITLTHKELILAKWQEINDKHANEMVKKANPASNQPSARELHEAIFGNNTNFSFAYHLVNFMVNSNFKIFSNEHDHRASLR